MKLTSKTFLLYSLLLCFFFLTGQQAMAQKETVFFVQLGAFSKTPAEQLEQVKSFGAVYSEKTGKNLQRYLLGQFAARTDAEKALKEVKLKGFPDAFIVERNSSNVPTIYDSIDMKNGSNAPKPVAEPAPPSRKNDQSKAYMVQVGVFSNKVRMNEILGLVSIGNIYTEKTAKTTKVFIGSFPSRKATEEPLRAAKAAGFKGAFIKEIALASVELLIEQRQGVPQSNTPNLVISTIAFTNPIEEFSLPYPTDTVEMQGNIFPINNQELLFHGQIKIKGDMYGQTLLLRTEDGGKNWAEVFKGEYGYGIDYLEFIDDKTAFLITMGFVEGPGVLTLYRTDNSGRTWKEVGEIPKNEHYCVPAYLRMNDLKFGTVVYNCEDETNFVWSTSDAGANWQYKGTMSKTAFKNLPPYQAESGNGIYATMDGTEFFKQVDTENVTIVFRLNATANAWEESFRLSRWYKLKNSKATPF